MQINPEYLAYFRELYRQKDMAKLKAEELNLSKEQKDIADAAIELAQTNIDDFDNKVKEWENIKKTDRINHETGFVE